ncbi:hypothetical protein GCM10008012_58820 [Rhizobium anhuiense]|nr:hypothetical protein GCM10008012_58820 [Rhizobium anhuiense]
MWSAAPADRFSKIVSRRKFGKFIDQSPCTIAEIISAQEDVDAWPPIVVLGNLVVKTDELRTIADQCGGIAELWRSLAQPGPNDISIETA